MSKIIELIPQAITGLALLFAGFWLRGWKRKKSDNTKADFDNRSDITEEWLIKLEKLSDIAGRNLMDKEAARSEILKLLRLAEQHFEICTAPKDDFSGFVKFLRNKYDRKAREN